MLVSRRIITFVPEIFCIIMETEQSTPVKFSNSAIKEINSLMQEDANKGKSLRVGVKGGGCSGMTYVLEFDEVKPNDVSFDIAGIPCIMDPSHEMYLFGMEIDWQNGLNNRGFTFKNPNASSTCGCGTSFAV